MVKSKGRKRVSLQEGDLLELPLPGGRVGYGIVVKRGALLNGGTPYVAVFRPAYDQRPHLSEISIGDVALQGWTTDALVYDGRWVVIGHDLPVPILSFPNFKVGMSGKVYVADVEGQIIDLATADELELLDYQFSDAANIFQDAFESLHGFGKWQDHFNKLTPTYAQSRVTRPSGSVH